MRRSVSSLVAVLCLSAAMLFAQDTAAPATSTAAPAPPAAATPSAETIGTVATAKAKDLQEPAPDAWSIMQKAVANDIIDWQIAKNYTFLQRVQEDTLDGSGGVKSSKSETSEVLVLYGEPFERVVAKGDKPLNDEEQKKQNEKFEKETNKRANESPEERQKRLQKFEKEREENREFVREILNAYDFTLVKSETVNGRATWVIDGTPRPGFEGKRREAKLLPKIKPRFWIDQQDYSWAKLRAEVTDTLSVGWILARLNKGSVFEMQQVRVNDEVWLPERVEVKLDGRVALLKGVNETVHVTYKDYKRFRSETKISEAEPAAVP